MFFNNNSGVRTNTVWANDYKIAVNPLYTSGHFGLITFQNNAGSPDATFDNFCATTATSSLTIVPSAGMADISWPANQEGIWVLECSPVLDPGVWTEIPFSSLTFAGGQFTYSAASVGNNFYRLRKI